MMEATCPQPGATRLDILEALAVEAGAESIAQEAHALAERLREGRFYVACVGQFKRGKSTLLNALVGAPVLPIGVVPVTAVVTILRHGQGNSARVRLEGKDWQSIEVSALAAYVSEEGNPENSKGVAGVEVFTPSPLLASGMCLVDTPGIGSVFAGNTEATRAFVPHVDAALVVLGADPPLSGDELALAGQIAKQCPDLLFALNKADRLSDAERQEAVDFTRRILSERLGRAAVPLYEVSATERLAGEGPPRGWPDLLAALHTLAMRSGSELVRNAEERGVALFAHGLTQRLEDERLALLQPLEESERRIAVLRTCAAEGERSLSYLGHLLEAEQERLGRIFSEREEQFLARALPASREELSEGIHAAAPRSGPKLRSHAVELSHAISRNWLDQWLAEAQPAAEDLYVQASQRFVDLANGFLRTLVASGDPALGALPQAMPPETGFRARSRLYYTSLMTYTSQNPAGWLADLFRSRERQMAAVERQVGAYLETLVSVNANRIVGDFNDRVLESRRRLQGDIRSSLTQVVASAERILAGARERRAQGQSAVQARLKHINKLSAQLAALGATVVEGNP